MSSVQFYGLNPLFLLFVSDSSIIGGDLIQHRTKMHMKVHSVTVCVTDTFPRSLASQISGLVSVCWTISQISPDARPLFCS